MHSKQQSLWNVQLDPALQLETLLTKLSQASLDFSRQLELLQAGSKRGVGFFQDQRALIRQQFYQQANRLITEVEIIRKEWFAEKNGSVATFDLN